MKTSSETLPNKLLMFPEEHLFTINLQLLLEEKFIQGKKQVLLSLGHVYLSGKVQKHRILLHHKVKRLF